MKKPKIGDFFKIYWWADKDKFMIVRVIRLSDDDFKVLRIYTNEKLWKNSILTTMNIPLLYDNENIAYEQISKDDVIMEML